MGVCPRGVAFATFCERMGWEIVAKFHDSKGGKSLDRAGFKKMIVAARRKEFDVLLLWDLSRLSRGGVLEALNVVQQLKSWGIAFRSLQ